jgi:ABC-type transport system involved in multi-copper enzyme maturation permease subunit
MTWLTWRQHRAMVTAFLLLFGGVAAFYLIDGVILHRAFDTAGLAQCVGVISDTACASRRREFLQFDVGLPQYFGPLLTLCSGALGVFLGAPLVATEFERGTHQWVWTQRISRTRWLATKYIVLTAVLVALSVGLSAAFTWWNEPVAALTGPFSWFGSFDNTPLMFTVYTIFGFAIGAVASTFVRRTVAAMGVTLLVFLVVRLGITFGLRPHYMTPVTVASSASSEGPLGFDPRDWDWTSRWVDATGQTVPQETMQRLTNPALNPEAVNTSWADVLQRHGIHYVDAVQPYQRAGTFQLIEAGIYLVLIALCVAVTFWHIRRRAI